MMLKVRYWWKESMHHISEPKINLGMAFYTYENRAKTSQLMFYVGFKDKLGIDVYEGDIIKDEFGRILLIEWYGAAFTLVALSETNFRRAFYIKQWFDDEKCLPEIIGNIYANPELLPKDAQEQSKSV